MKRSIYTLCKSDLTSLQSRLPNIALSTGQQRCQRQHLRQQTQLQQRRRQYQPLPVRQTPSKTSRTPRGALLQPVQPRDQKRVAGQRLSESQRQVQGTNVNVNESISNTTFIISRSSRDYPVAGTTPSNNNAWSNVGTGRICMPAINNVTSGSIATRSTVVGAPSVKRSATTATTATTSPATTTRKICFSDHNRSNGTQVPTVSRNCLAAANSSGITKTKYPREPAVANRILNMCPFRTGDDRRQVALKEALIKRVTNSLRDGRTENSNSHTLPVTSTPRTSMACRRTTMNRNKSSDAVALYQYYKRNWENCHIPGQSNVTSHTAVCLDSMRKRTA